MHLQKDGYGVDKEIPTTLIASASFSDIIAIEIFGIFTEFELNKVSDKKKGNENDIFFNLVFIVCGIIAGAFTGLFLGLALVKLKKKLFIKTLGILACLVIFITIVHFTHYYESLFVCTLTFAYVLHLIWKDEKPQKQMHWVLKFMKPFLFGTIGAAIKIDELKPEVIPYAILIVSCGLIIRCVVTYFCVMNKKFNVGERLLFVIAWTPKATVQAVLGGLVLDWARKELNSDNPDRDRYEEYGLEMLTTAVISIFMTAPLGAILTENLGKRWLHKTEVDKLGDDPIKSINQNAIAQDPEAAVAKKSENSGSSASKSSKESSKVIDDDNSARLDSNMALHLPNIERRVLDEEGIPKFNPDLNKLNISVQNPPIDQLQDRHIEKRMSFKYQ